MSRFVGLELIAGFTPRNAHFMIGKEDEKKAEDDDAMSPDPKYGII